MTAVATDRYVTSDFNSAPLAALADLMGLNGYQSQIMASPELFSPILNGISVYRHIESPQRREILSAIRNDVPRGQLTDKLMGLVTSQIVQPYWYMWSLSDEELLEFFNFSQAKTSATEPLSVGSLPDFSVGSLATALVVMSLKGPRAALKEQAQGQIDALMKKSGLVQEISKRLGIGGRLLSAIGIASIPTIIVISGLNIMASKESEVARRELAARGLLAYQDL
ncbi:hypothetical protein ACJO2E_03380 [Marinobacter sp. M1N3S26]|uniref:hypothetical protein n=1 Tax=Marinobacter sp. M1N3S26 TaxID=3382299 RepID=UPI00387B8874